MNAPATDITVERDWVLLALEGKLRGFKSPLSFRRWCRRHAVPVLRDGKMLWVRRVDVDGVLERIANPPSAPAPVASAVRKLTGGAG